MLASLALAAMLASLPVDAPSSSETPTSPAPASETKSYSDTSKLPLQVLQNLPVPTSFDYDGDHKPDPITFDMAPSGAIRLSAKSSKTGKVQTLFVSKASLTELGANQLGMRVTGDPTDGAVLDLWGIKGDKPLPKLSLALSRASFTLSAEGKKHTYAWSGDSFVAK